MTFFDNAYEGTPTWDLGRPQAAVVRLAESGLVDGAVLDVGCGTGENALFLAARGHHVTGVDLARSAIAQATAKAAERQIAAEFVVADALELERLGQQFDTVIDVGCFHALQPFDRPRYAASVRAALRPGGRAIVLCWSDRNPFGYGPERVSRRDIRATFRTGWLVEGIDGETLETLMPAERVHAWLARLLRR
jgi:SAM-dependent methyltransferase